MTVECEHCAASDRVRDATQKMAYRADKARIEADDRARVAEAELAEAKARVLVLRERVSYWMGQHGEAVGKLTLAEEALARVRGAVLKP
jgi:hypothetical protein